MNHKEYITKYKAQKIKVHVSKIDARKVVSSGYMPKRYFYTELFFGWLWILSFPTSIAVFIWSELWIGIIILAIGCMIPSATRESCCQFVLWHSIENEEFYNLVLDKEVIVIEEV